jgi:hypothetical protein
LYDEIRQCNRTKSSFFPLDSLSSLHCECNSSVLKICFLKRVQLVS